MGQLNNVNKVPEALRKKVVEMLNDPSLSQLEIVDSINSEAGKQVITKSSLSRFVQCREKLTGTKRGTSVPSAEESLLRIAAAVERIAYSPEKRPKKTSKTVVIGQKTGGF